MKKITHFIGVVILTVLTGCATGPGPSAQYAAANLQLAEQGKMKWSDYYTGLYNSALQSNQRNKAQIMGRASVMIDAAKTYERGGISDDQFQSLRRQVQTAQVADEEAANARTRAALAAAAKSMGDSMQRNSESTYKIVQPTTTTTNTTCNSFGGQLKCTSRTQ